MLGTATPIKFYLADGRYLQQYDYSAYTSLAGQPTSAQGGKGLVNALTDVCSHVLLAAHQSGCRFLSHDQLPRNHGEVL